MSYVIRNQEYDFVNPPRLMGKLDKLECNRFKPIKLGSMKAHAQMQRML